MVKDIDFKESFLGWLEEITFGKKELYYKVIEDTKLNRFSIYLYTYTYRYCISCGRRYLGCTVSRRTSIAGEDWYVSAIDLLKQTTGTIEKPKVQPTLVVDGNFCMQTWELIKNEIIKHELEQICDCVACKEESLVVDENI